MLEPCPVVTASVVCSIDLPDCGVSMIASCGPTSGLLGCSTLGGVVNRPLLTAASRALTSRAVAVHSTDSMKTANLAHGHDGCSEGPFEVGVSLSPASYTNKHFRCGCSNVERFSMSIRAKRDHCTALRTVQHPWASTIQVVIGTRVHSCSKTAEAVLYARDYRIG